MDEHIADRCVAGLKADYKVSDDDANALKEAILNHMKLERRGADPSDIVESTKLMNEITERIKANSK